LGVLFLVLIPIIYLSMTYGPQRNVQYSKVR
jgi:hypothetical protein